MDITVDSGLLEKTTMFVQHAAPQLEKQASEKRAFEAMAPALVDKMISVGVVNPASRDAAIADLANGGLAKAASVIEFLAGRVTTPSMGTPATEKRASAGRRDRHADSDAAFEAGILS